MSQDYDTIAIIVAVLGSYFVTWLLVKTKKINLATHRKFWNLILLATFLVSALLGLLLAILIDQEMVIQGYRKILTLHVKFGIAMTIIALFHTVWHWRYYWGLVKKRE